jgi:hypothetical protein
LIADFFSLFELKLSTSLNIVNGILTNLDLNICENNDPCFLNILIEIEVLIESIIGTV